MIKIFIFVQTQKFSCFYTYSGVGLAEIFDRYPVPIGTQKNFSDRYLVPIGTQKKFGWYPVPIGAQKFWWVLMPTPAYLVKCRDGRLSRKKQEFRIFRLLKCSSAIFKGI